MESAHTPNEKLKYKCDTCGKGFASKQRIEDHKNVHTGEKPHKCQFCSTCFASFGNMRMHERGHLGHKRKWVKFEISNRLKGLIDSYSYT